MSELLPSGVDQDGRCIERRSRGVVAAETDLGIAAARGRLVPGDHEAAAGKSDDRRLGCIRRTGRDKAIEYGRDSIGAVDVHVDVAATARIVTDPADDVATIRKRRDIGPVDVDAVDQDIDAAGGHAVGIEQARADVAAGIVLGIRVGHDEAAVGETRDAGIGLEGRRGRADGEFVRPRVDAGEQAPHHVGAGRIGSPHRDVSGAGRIAGECGRPLRSLRHAIGQNDVRAAETIRNRSHLSAPGMPSVTGRAASAVARSSCQSFTGRSSGLPAAPIASTGATFFGFRPARASRRPPRNAHRNIGMAPPSSREMP